MKNWFEKLLFLAVIYKIVLRFFTEFPLIKTYVGISTRPRPSVFINKKLFKTPSIFYLFLTSSEPIYQRRTSPHPACWYNLPMTCTPIIAFTSQLNYNLNGILMMFEIKFKIAWLYHVIKLSGSNDQWLSREAVVTRTN